MKKFHKRGVASLATFSLIILIGILVFLLSYGFYSDSKGDIEALSKKDSMIKEISNFRSEILNLAVHENSSLEYYDAFSNDIILNLQGSYIYSSYVLEDEILEVNMTTFGLSFCSDYEIGLNALNVFFFNGSCVSITN